MNDLSPSRLLLYLFSLLLSMALPEVSASLSQEDQPVQLKKGTLDVPIPSNLKALHITNPYAKILIEVDPQGTIVDIMPIEASHFELLEPGLKAIRKASFAPAVADGKPFQSKAAVYVNFFDLEQRAWRSGAGVVPFGDSVSDAAKSRLYQLAPGRYVYGESNPRELDAPLRLKAGKIRVYHSEEGVRQSGQCLVEYYVGPEGEVHFPRIIKSDHEDLSTSALLTLDTTVFEPPRRDGKPTCVRIRQPFNFR